MVVDKKFRPKIFESVSFFDLFWKMNYYLDKTIL